MSKASLPNTIHQRSTNNLEQDGRKKIHRNKATKMNTKRNTTIPPKPRKIIKRKHAMKQPNTAQKGKRHKTNVHTLACYFLSASIVSDNLSLRPGYRQWRISLLLLWRLMSSDERLLLHYWATRNASLPEYWAA